MAGPTAARVAAWREGRRLRALALKAPGWAQRRLAEALGVTDYAPELNPTEGLWTRLKRGQLNNLFCEALWDLQIEVRLALARLRHRPAALRGRIRHAGYLL